MSRVALVTGASRGIGKAIALRLAQSDHRVAVNYAASGDAAEGVVAQIEAGGGEALAIQADVSDEAAVGAMFGAVSERFGSVEVLINNAGITDDDLLMRMKPAAWDRVLEVNLRSVYLCTRAALRAMVRAKWGRVVSVASVAGVSGNAGQANYAASKAGLNGLARSLAREFASRGITVNLVAPGPIETDMLAELGEATIQAMLDTVPVGRVGTAEEVAAAVSFLTSEAAGYVTGATIPVDGGLGMGA